MNEQPFEEAKRQFDDMNEQVARASLSISWVPAEHKNIYETAQLNAYGRAGELLKENPDLITYFKEAGRLILALSADEQLKMASLSQITRLAEKGLIDDVKVWDLAQLRSEHGYQAKHFKAFEELFSSIIDQVASTPSEPTEPSEMTEEEFENEINTVDIMEFLAKQDFNQAQLKLIERALDETVSIDRLRKEEYTFIALSKEELGELIDDYSSLRFRVVNFLKTVDVPSKWVQPNTRRRQDYRLLIGPEALEATKTDPKEALKNLYGHNFEVFQGRQPRRRPSSPEPEAVKPTREVHVAKAEPEARPFEVGAAAFARDLKIAMKEILLLSSDPKISPIARKVAGLLGVEYLEARSALINLVQSGDLFYGASQQGNRTLLAEAPSEPIIKRRQKKAGNAEIISQAGFTDREMHIARKLCNALIKARYQNKGLILNEVVDVVGEDEAEVRQVASRLAERERLTREVRRIKTRGGSRSRANRETTWIKFPSQEAWDAFRDSPDEYLKIMLEDRTGEASSSAKQMDQAFSIDEMILADSVFNAIVGVGHQAKGIPLNDLVKALGIGDESGRGFISRIVNRGLLMRDQAWERSRSPHSRKRETVLIKFPTQEAWNRFRQDPAEYIESLKNPA